MIQVLCGDIQSVVVDHACFSSAARGLNNDDCVPAFVCTFSLLCPELERSVLKDCSASYVVRFRLGTKLDRAELSGRTIFFENDFSRHRMKRGASTAAGDEGEKKDRSE